MPARPTPRPRTADRPKRANGAGSFYFERDRGVWRCAVPTADGKRLTRRTKTDSVAERDALMVTLAAEAADLARASGTADAGPKRGPWTVGTWLTYWRTNVGAKRRGRHGSGLAKTTRDREEWMTEAITDALGSVALRALTTEDVESFLRAKAEGVGVAKRPWSAGTCGLVRLFLERVLDEAVGRGHVGRNVATRAQIPDVATDPKKRSPLTEADAATIYGAARKSEAAAAPVIAFLLTTGARVGEAVAVQWADIDTDARVWTIPKSKTDTGIRKVRLVGPAWDVIRDQRNRAGLLSRDPDAYVFPGDKAAKVARQSVVNELERLAVDNGVTVMDDDRVPRPHELRHTVASALIDQGLAPQDVADLLGNHIKTTMDTYRHKLRPVAGDGAADAMASIYGAA